MLSTEHLLYILDEIDLMVDTQFDADYVAAKHVIMNRQRLIDILDVDNSENIGVDLCSMIAAFVMRKDDSLCHYLQNERILKMVSRQKRKVPTAWPSSETAKAHRG
eukprot:TRINITY_DN7665_c0_g1_i1.p2 TRINITY_DN7665_c0_g1~~TRINITY_DN7665_c0_g1_i1.p2  ORF type:complete len:106 (+),score=34.84 TRINITY_DN7665_c0_g1_i1:430-747(+)